MIGEHYEGVHINAVALGRTGEDADEDLSQPRRWSQQKPALHSSSCDLDETPFRHEAQAACHAEKNGIGGAALSGARSTGSAETLSGTVFGFLLAVATDGTRVLSHFLLAVLASKADDVRLAPLAPGSRR